MTRLANDLVYEFLSIADDLAGRPAGKLVELNACRRRAVSTAYYAVFHALSFVCADTLSGPDHDPDMLALLYRALDRAELKATLESAEMLQLAPTLRAVGEAFKNLQERRFKADYAAPDFTIGGAETLELAGIARGAIALLEDLDFPTRRTLAVLLLAKSRPR
ncbi:hypothetical protein [uncultured Enterovirga sp.]|uniref:hypothetical protein n=1 Tax=uncultured Enterovirga sp. TaxID=2026352 RepID=UPI0035C9DD81